MEKPFLSKSTFIRGLQCEKSLYLYKHHYNLKDETPAQLKAIFSQGTNVGLLAQGLFPNGVDASHQTILKCKNRFLKPKILLPMKKASFMKQPSNLMVFSRFKPSCKINWLLECLEG